MSIRISLFPSRSRLFRSILNQDLKIIRTYHAIPKILQQKCQELYLNSQFRYKTYSNPTGTPGSGAGRGGGAGGSVRESGGGLGQYGAAQEEQFFYNKQRELLEKLKKKLKEGKPGELSQKEEK